MVNVHFYQKKVKEIPFVIMDHSNQHGEEKYEKVTACIDDIIYDCYDHNTC